MGYGYDTDQTQICSPGTKLTRIHTQNADITLSMWTVNRCVAPRSGCPRIPWRSSYCRPRFANKWLAAHRYRCQRVCSLVHGCSSQGWYSLHGSNQRRMAIMCTVALTSKHGDAAGLSCITGHDGDWTLTLVCVARYERPWHQSTLLPDASDRGLLIWMWRKQQLS